MRQNSLRVVEHYVAAIVGTETAVEANE